VFFNIRFISLIAIGLSCSALAQFSLYEEKASLYKKVFGIEMPEPVFRDISVDMYIDGQYIDKKENIKWDSTNNNIILPKSILSVIEPHFKPGVSIDPVWIKDNNILNISIMRKRGFDISFNIELFRLEIKTPPDIRRRLTISYMPKNLRDIEYTSKPLSGYFNLYSSNSYDSDSIEEYSGSQLVEASLSWNNLTFQYEGEHEDSISQEWYNRGARIIVENSDSHIILGDQEPQNIDWSLAPPPLAKGINSHLFGIGINKRVSMGDYDVAYTSDFYYDFIISSDSEIMVYVNGKITYQVELPSGRYRLKDIPLEAGLNKIRIDTVGSDGTYNKVQDTYYQRYDMLKMGQMEYDIAVGSPYIKDDNLSELDNDNKLVLGYLRYGLNDKLTLGSYLQYQEKLKVFGFIQQWGTSLGYLTLDVAGSKDEIGDTGWAKQFEWSSDARYTPIGSYEATFTGYGLRTNYFSEDFKSNYEVNEVDFPWDIPDIRSLVAPYLSLGFSTNTQLSILAGRVDFHNPDIDTAFGWGARLEQSVGDINMWCTYSSIQYAGETNKYWAINFEWRPYGSSHYVKSNYDSQLERSKVAYEYVDPANSFTRYHVENTYKDSKNKSIKIYSEYRKGYSQSKYQFSESLYDGIKERRGQWISGGARGKSVLDASYIDSKEYSASWYVETGVAFAGNNWGITKPIKDSFAIFYANPGFEGNVEFGDGARIDSFGSAVVSDISSYEVSEYKVNATDLSSLASIDNSSFKVKNRYASGTAIGVGSSANMFLRGILVDQYNEPIILKAGRLIPLSGNSDEVMFFTGEDGKITVKGISVGKWRVTLLGETDEVVIDVLYEKSSIVEIGTIVVKINE